MSIRRSVTSILRFQRPAFRGATFGVCSAITGLVLALPAQASAQGSSGSAWSLPDANGLMTQVIRRIVTQDKPGGLPIADYADRAFGREETETAVRAFAMRNGGLSPSIFSAVNEWPVARADDALPCARTTVITNVAQSNIAVATVVAPGVASPGPSSLAEAAPSVTDSAATVCGFSNALWLAVTKVERGELPHELHVWYATRFRTDVQGSVQSATYSFCERWLRVGGVWKYDGFVRMTKGVVAPALSR